MAEVLQFSKKPADDLAQERIRVGYEYSNAKTPSDRLKALAKFNHLRVRQAIIDGFH